MSNSHPDSPSDDYFNDLSRQPNTHTDDHRPSNERSHSSENTIADGGISNNNSNSDLLPKPKRIACVVCRKRKLRCDGNKPSCGTCTRLAHDCSYDEVRRKSGPKRGYVKALEARLQQVETLLKTQDSVDDVREGGNDAAVAMNGSAGILNGANDSFMFTANGQASPGAFVDGPTNVSTEKQGEGNFPWEMIGLGLDEPLPNQDVINDLHQVYFEKVHTSLPMIHRPRYMAAMNLAPHMRPPICLRYIMWCLAAQVTDKYEGLQEHFYQRARKYAQMDELRGHGESTITVAHAQAWVLIANYEFKLMYFPRAWLSVGKAIRMCQMMGLHRLDGVGLDVKQCLAPPRDWTEREERRRTFWMAFCADRYASIGTGWPMTVEEKDIMTNLPATEEAYDKSKPVRTMSLEQAMDPAGATALSPFAGVVLMACLFGRNLTHLHRPGPDDHDEDLQGEFWKRHRHLDTILLNTALALPDHLRLPSGLPDANIVFLNMNIHTSTICLHQAAIFKADKNRLPINVSSESKIRCITAAAEIASIMRMISHLDLSAMNPFVSFCLYVAARVFVQYLKSRPKDQQVKTSLQFLLTAMNAIKRKNPLTESFLVQLDVDLEGSGIDVSSRGPSSGKMPPGGVVPINTDAVHCSPLLDIRSTQSGAAPINQFNSSSASPNIASTGRSPITNIPRSGFPPTRSPFSVDVEREVGNVSYMPFGSNRGREASLELPSRSRPTGPGDAIGNHLLPGDQDAEMDTSPDGSGMDQPTPNSVNGRASSSNTSYTPPGQEDALNNSNLFFGSVPTHNPSISTPGSNPSAHSQPNRHPAGNSQSFFDPTVADMGSIDDFSTLLFQNQDQTGGFVMPPGWDLGDANMGMAGAGGGAVRTGMTPMASGGDWTQMMDAQLGWENMLGQHGMDVFGRRG